MKITVKQLIIGLVGIIFLLCLSIFCVQQISYFKKQQEAKLGRETLVGQLPKLKNFDVIETVYQDFPDKITGRTCYYARTHLVIGTSMPESKALDAYEQNLKILNWISGGQQYETSRVLHYGDNDRVVVRSGEPGIDVKNVVDYDQLRETYQSIIFVRVDYMVPNREMC